MFLFVAVLMHPAARSGVCVFVICLSLPGGSPPAGAWRHHGGIMVPQCALLRYSQLYPVIGVTELLVGWDPDWLWYNDYNCLVVTGKWLDYDFPNLSHHIGNGIIIPAAQLNSIIFQRARAKKHQPDPWVNPHGSQVGGQPHKARKVRLQSSVV
jgi:hypothetical protein